MVSNGSLGYIEGKGLREIAVFLYVRRRVLCYPTDLCYVIQADGA